jgi:hypothetical protein
MSEINYIFDGLLLSGYSEEEEIQSWIDLQKAFLTEEDIKEEEDDICRQLVI